MTNSVKIKFVGWLRGLLRRLDDDEATAPQTPRALAVAAPPVTIAPASTMPPAPAENPDELQLPLQSILAAMPMDLRAKVMQTPPAGMMIAVPLEKILTQLAFGSVKIAFGELRTAAPGVFVNSGGEHDHKPVMLPLNEILTRLNPALLSRRSAQKQVEVTEDITGPFGAGGEGGKISAAAKPTPSAAMPPLRMTTPPPFSFASRAITPVTGATIPLPPPFMPQATAPATSVVTPRSNGAPKPVAPIPSPAPQIPVEPAVISAPLAALSENWPEGLRLEIRQSNLANAQVLLPANLIEPALKRGRVTFTWRNLRPLIKPTPPPASVHDGIELELPLNVIAPLFFARQKTALRSQPAKRPPAEIPNLFFGFPQPEISQPKPPPARMPEPQPVRPAAKPVDAKLSDTNYYIWSDTAEAPRVDETEYKLPQRPATDLDRKSVV